VKGRKVTVLITATHKRVIDHYYKELAAYHIDKVTHETAVRSAFQNLLAAFAPSVTFDINCDIYGDE